MESDATSEQNQVHIERYYTSHYIEMKTTTLSHHLFNLHINVQKFCRNMFTCVYLHIVLSDFVLCEPN